MREFDFLPFKASHYAWEPQATGGSDTSSDIMNRQVDYDDARKITAAKQCIPMRKLP